MNTNLLKEAIADADAIKKLAIENAKASLNEAFDSKIKSMLSARLEEEADDLEEEYEEEDEKSQDEAKKGHQEPDEDNEGGESDHDADNKEDEADEAFNIDAILAEMEKDGAEDSQEEDEDDEAYHGKDEAKGAEEKTDDMEDEEDADQEEAPKGGEEGGDSETDIDEIDIEALLNELKGEEEDDEAYHGKESMDEESEDEEEEDQEEKDEVKTLEEEMMSLLEKMKQAKAAKAAKAKKMEKPETEELQEIKRQAAELTQKVNETNLINAKLLYLNKILRKYNLSEQQKLKVIGAFDKANTINEAKIVHESLDQAFSVKNENVKGGIKESIGFASSAAGTSTKRVITEGVIENVDKQVSRWQKLAGIIK